MDIYYNLSWICCEIWPNNKYETNVMFSCLILLVITLFLWYFCNEYFGINTNEYITIHYIYEMLEIMLQIHELLVYDGYGKDVLTNDTEFIYLFVIFSYIFCWLQFFLLLL